MNFKEYSTRTGSSESKPESTQKEKPIPASVEVESAYAYRSSRKQPDKPAGKSSVEKKEE